eukprot:TRINITY_DN1847_c0_g2_i12.p1 TRINITY_DN1847_c0_g2~~TRINITY_DN1847_c0_g2_i12.p1  ORF type:complete len:273 (-),score=48.18 TRINITY_DN1847_c0_g2_i12:210-917(-)
MSKMAPTSIVPIISAATISGISPLDYDVVTERQNMRLLMYSKGKKWRIGVQRIGHTLFLRRFWSHHWDDLYSTGRQFERMICSPGTPGAHNQLITAKLGQFSLLYFAETDAVDRWGSPLELKTGTNALSHLGDLWAQTFFGRVSHVICAPPQGSSIRWVKTLSMARLTQRVGLARCEKLLATFERAVDWLMVSSRDVAEGTPLMLRRVENNLVLEVVGPADSFVSREMIENLVAM